jgi:hypothetical protein
MYYFMDRYRHARRAFEEFVYLDHSHPRTGDAVKEYLHTHEKLGPPAGRLLALYDALSRRYPDALIHDRTPVTGLIRNGDWLRLRSATVLLKMGRFRQAAERADRYEWGGTACTISHHALRLHYCLTGELWTPKWLTDWDVWGESLLAFAAGQTRKAVRIAPRRAKGWYHHAHTRRRFTYEPRDYGEERNFFLLAPTGKVFSSLRVRPTTESGSGPVQIVLSKDRRCDVAKETARPGRETIVFQPVPLAGILQVQCIPQPGAGPLRGLEIEATFEDVGPHGAIRVACSNAAQFAVGVDGRYGRSSAGMIGPVKPGRHVLTFRSMHSGSPYLARKVTVDVKPDHVTSVVVDLPWRRDSAWSSWTSGTLIGRNYPGVCVSLRESAQRPGIQADEEAIRIVWSHAGDIWSSVSTDGATFTAPARLPMPVSSGWLESMPKLLLAEDGRFLLTFLSDRGGQYQIRPYVAWSRDLRHWSAPVAVTGRPLSSDYGITQDSRGRFLLAGNWKSRITVHASTDAYRWRRIVTVPLEKKDAPVFQGVVERADGVLELIFAIRARRPSTVAHTPARIYSSRSSDGVTWSTARLLGQIDWPGELYASLHHRAGETTLACFGIREWRHQYGKAYYWWDNQRVVAVRADGIYIFPPQDYAIEAVRDTASPFEWAAEYDLWILKEGRDGARMQAGETGGVAQGIGSMAHHSRWGYMIAWMAPQAAWGFPRPAYGPLFIRGPDLGPWRPARPGRNSP